MQNPQTRIRGNGTTQASFVESGIAWGQSGEAGKLVTEDPTLYELALRPWELMCSPLDRGSFRHELVFLKTPGFVLYREIYDLAVSIQGLAPPGMLALSVPLNLGPRTAYWKRPVECGSMPSTLPGPLDVRFDTDHSHVIALVHLDLIRRHIPEYLLPAVISIGKNRRASLPDRIVHAFAAWMAQVLKVAKRDPATLVAESTVITIEQELFTLLLRIAEAMTPNLPVPPASAQWQGLKGALEYLRHAKVAKVTIPELCRAAGVSERTLQYAFRDVFGLTPLGFLRRRHLHAARQHLLISNRDETTVSQIAVAQGCYELGRFAVEYRQVFGEQPSETLRRPATVPDTNLSMP